MTTNMSARELAQQIEHLVEDFIAGGRLAATKAVDRAFASARTQSPAKRPSRSERARRPTSRRRSPEEMAKLSERLYDAVCANPGETMSVIAPVVGANPRELQPVAARLRRDGRIRTVGQRRFTRYFPMVKGMAKPG
jgi:hypothetical protein